MLWPMFPISWHNDTGTALASDWHQRKPGSSDDQPTYEMAIAATDLRRRRRHRPGGNERFNTQPSTKTSRCRGGALGMSLLRRRVRAADIPQRGEADQIGRASCRERWWVMGIGGD